MSDCLEEDQACGKPHTDFVPHLFLFPSCVSIVYCNGPVLFCSALFRPLFFFFFFFFWLFLRTQIGQNFWVFLLQFPKCWGDFSCLITFLCIFLFSFCYPMELLYLFPLSLLLHPFIRFSFFYFLCAALILMTSSFTFFPYCSQSLIPCYILCFCTHPKFRVGQLF